MSLHPTPRPSLAIFDLDGTLVDSMPLLTQLAVHVLKTMQITPMPREDYLATVGRPFIEQARMICDKYRYRVPAIFAHEAANHYEALHAMVAPYMPVAPKMDHLLHLSAARNIALALVSSTDRAIITTMKQLPLHAFDVYGNQPHHNKPRQIISAIANYSSETAVCYFSSETAVCYFGDTDHDADVALTLGIPFYRVTTETVVTQFIKHFAPDDPRAHHVGKSSLPE